MNSYIFLHVIVGNNNGNGNTDGGNHGNGFGNNNEPNGNNQGNGPLWPNGQNNQGGTSGQNNTGLYSTILHHESVFPLIHTRYTSAERSVFVFVKSYRNVD